MQTKMMNCINCPLGCELTVTVDAEGKLVSVAGNTCPRGAQYARDEITAPTRMLTSTVKIKNGFLPLLPVVSGGRLPKDKVLACAEALRHVEVTAPVQAGAVVVKNILGLGVDIIASRDLRVK